MFLIDLVVVLGLFIFQMFNFQILSCLVLILDRFHHQFLTHLKLGLLGQFNLTQSTHQLAKKLDQLHQGIALELFQAQSVLSFQVLRRQLSVNFFLFHLVL